MPAPAVIPAPIAYIKVVAVKKLVVGLQNLVRCWSAEMVCTNRTVLLSSCCWLILTDWLVSSGSFTLKKLECLKQAINALNISAWDNRIGLVRYFVGLGETVMINRDSWGRLYLIVRGEILGFNKDKLMRKHSPRMFSLIKNES